MTKTLSGKLLIIEDMITLDTGVQDAKQFDGKEVIITIFEVKKHD